MPNGATETMNDQDQDAPQGQSAAPDRDSGGIRERVLVLEAQREHLATKADLTEQVSKLREDNSRMREDTNRQFAELRKENAELRAEAVEREARILKQMAELQSSVEGRFSSIIKWGGGFWLSSLALAVLISRSVPPAAGG